MESATSSHSIIQKNDTLPIRRRSVFQREGSLFQRRSAHVSNADSVSSYSTENVSNDKIERSAQIFMKVIYWTFGLSCLSYWIAFLAIKENNHEVKTKIVEPPVLHDRAHIVSVELRTFDGYSSKKGDVFVRLSDGRLGSLIDTNFTMKEVL